MRSSAVIKSMIILFVCGTASAWWTGDAATSNWFTAGNWSELAVPNSSTTDVEILNIYGTSAEPILNNGTVNVQNCWVGGHYGHPGRLIINTGGALITSGQLLIGQGDPISLDPSGLGNTVEVLGGSLAVNNNMAVGWLSSGNFYQTDGAVTVGVSGSNTVYIGADTVESGYMELSGGTFNAIGTKFSPRGVLDIKKGQVVVNGGTVRFGNVMLVGKDPNQTDPELAKVTVQSGQLNCDGGSGTGLAVGYSGNGKFLQIGGTVNLVNSYNPAVAVSLFLGVFEPAWGIVDIQGSSSVFTVGGIYSNKGSILLNGGQMNVNGDIWLTEPGGASRTDNKDENAPEFVVNSGTLTVSGNLAAGHSGDSKWTQTGGTVNVGNGTPVGSMLMTVYDGTAEGFMSGGTFNADNWVLGGGYGDAGMGFFEMTGGIINTPYTTQYSGYFLISEQGNSTLYPEGTISTFAMSDGTINADSMTVGRRGTGGLLMSGGAVNITQRLWIGTFTSGVTRPNETPFVYSGFQKGLIELAGGQINVGTDVVFNSDSNKGKIDLCGGTLVLNGDRRTSAQTWITNQSIVACGGLATVVYDYNVTNPGKTTVKSSCAGFPAGDLSTDCAVNFEDFAILAENYLQDAGPGCTSYPVGDIDHSCIVDINDLLELAASWLQDNGTL